MNIGTSIRTLPTVKPKLYAGKVGTIATKNEDEFGVLINGKIVWFVEKEIEEWTNAQSTKTPGCREISTGVNVAPTTFQSSARAKTTDAHRTDSPAIRPGPPQRPLTNPPRAVPGSERPSEPRPPSAPPRGSGDLSRFKDSEGQERVTTNPERAYTVSEAVSDLEAVSGASWSVQRQDVNCGCGPLGPLDTHSWSCSGTDEGSQIGTRGPSGGVVAKCVECGGLWERPKQRGRPSLKCEGCRE